ncbi:hypothetical protein GJ496_006113 [Pomphorhynchus laevis]|nr:hypothetical protein GJ496_006113 [Pomphorhynchus laevis]
MVTRGCCILIGRKSLVEDIFISAPLINTILSMQFMECHLSGVAPNIQPKPQIWGYHIENLIRCTITTM